MASSTLIRFPFSLLSWRCDRGRTPDSDRALHSELLNFPACCRSPDAYRFFILYYAEPILTPSLTSWRKLTVFCLVGFRRMSAGRLGEIESGVSFEVTPLPNAVLCSTARCQCRSGYFFSMPLVAPLPGLVAQQNAESSPQALQLCLSSVMSPLAWPTTVNVDLQPAHAWVPISSVGWPCSLRICAPFTPCFTPVTQTVLHLAHTIAMVSSVFSASTCCLVWIPWSMSRCSPPFIGFICSAARAVTGGAASM